MVPESITHDRSTALCLFVWFRHRLHWASSGTYSPSEGFNRCDDAVLHAIHFTMPQALQGFSLPVSHPAPKPGAGASTDSTSGAMASDDKVIEQVSFNSSEHLAAATLC